jgi:hypothetical protein
MKQSNNQSQKNQSGQSIYNISTMTKIQTHQFDKVSRQIAKEFDTGFEQYQLSQLNNTSDERQSASIIR